EHNVCISVSGMVAQEPAQERHIDVPVLLLKQHGRPAPAAQIGSLGAGVLQKDRREIELAAVLGPPTLLDGITGQAARDAVPILMDHACTADGPHLANFLTDPVLACGL